MNDEIIIKKFFPEDTPDINKWDIYNKIEKDIINTLSENQFTISQARYLFNNIIERFERKMPVTNHKKD